MSERKNMQMAFEAERLAREHAEHILHEKTQELLQIQQALQNNYNEMRRNLAESALIFSLSRLARTDFKISEALYLFIEGICKLNNWQVGHIFRIDKKSETDSSLFSSSIWYFSDPQQYNSLKVITDECVFCTYSNDNPQHWEGAIIDDGTGTRLKHLKQLNLKGAITVPIRTYGNLIATAEFFATQEIHQDSDLISSLSTLVNQLGIILERQHNERQLRRNYVELEKVHHELKNTQTQLLQHSTLVSVGQLAAGIAHEINTPVQYIGDNARFLQAAFDKIIPLIQENPTQNADIEYLCKEIPHAIKQSLDGVEHITGIVKAMREFVHPGSAEKTSTDLNHALLNTIAVSKNEWKYLAEIKCDLDPNLQYVHCLPNEMNQVFLNLIVNAAQSIEPKLRQGATQKGIIEVQSKKIDQMAEIRIKDTGMGIPAEVQHRVFEPFFTTKEVGKGTGQGLSIVHSIVVGKHKGKIWFETQENIGTTFIVQIPIN